MSFIRIGFFTRILWTLKGLFICHSPIFTCWDILCFYILIKGLGANWIKVIWITDIKSNVFYIVISFWFFWPLRVANDGKNHWKVLMYMAVIYCFHLEILKFKSCQLETQLFRAEKKKIRQTHFLKAFLMLLCNFQLFIYTLIDFYTSAKHFLVIKFKKKCVLTLEIGRNWKIHNLFKNLF